jgi:hypothetical protein
MPRNENFVDVIADAFMDNIKELVNEAFKFGK